MSISASSVNAFVIARYRKDINSFLQRCYEICLSLGRPTISHFACDSIVLMPSPFVDIDAVRNAHEDGIVDDQLYGRCVEAVLSGIT